LVPEETQNPIVSDHDSNGRQQYGWSCCAKPECRGVFTAIEEKRNREEAETLKKLCGDDIFFL
tara:strand:- start:351 stop:539 length:189 start_codon:yes stop_codon:yes gene_type:complete